MQKYKFGSIVDSDFRNTLQRLANDFETQGRFMHELIRKGEVTVDDIDLNEGKLEERHLSDGSITENKLDPNVRGMIRGKQIEDTTNLNNVSTPGVYTQNLGANAEESLNYPPGNQAGVLEVRDMGSNIISQVYTMPVVGESWTRRRYVGNWGDWLRVGREELLGVIGTLDLNDLTSTSEWTQTTTNNVTPERNYPPVNGQFKRGILLVYEAGSSVTQTYIADRAGEIWVRDRRADGQWFDWKRIGENIVPELPEIPHNAGKPTLEMELTGRWTPNDKGDEFLLSFENHELVEVVEAGRSVEDWPIYVAIIGDPTKPAILVNAGAHGTEVGPPEAAWLLVRDLTESKSMLHMDVCIIVVPNQNPDNRFNARGNRNAVDLNRDWIDRSQPETQAVESLINTYNVVAAIDMHNFGYPRQVSLQEALNGSDEVKAASQGIYDAVMTDLLDDDQPARRYAPELSENSFVNGLATVNNIPSITLEIPCGGYAEWTFDVYYPTPSWQAHVGVLSCYALFHHVWENLESFEALQEG